MLTLAALHPDLLRICPLACSLVFAVIACFPARLLAQMSQRGHHAPKIDYTKADKHALATPPDKAADLQSLATHLTQAFKTEQEKTRAIFRWITANIAYDYPYFRAVTAVAQCNFQENKLTFYYDKRQQVFSDSLQSLARQKKTMKPAAWKAARKDSLLKAYTTAKAADTKSHKISLKALHEQTIIAEKAVAGFLKKGHHIQDAATMLKRRIGVCAGYSELFHALAQKAGLQSEAIGGSVKSAHSHVLHRGGAFGHAWNAVRIKNKWWMLDCTWADDGPTVDEHWFLIAPEQLVHSHAARDTTKQFLAKAIPTSDFHNLPPEGEYSRYDAQILDAQRTNIITDSAAVFTVSVPRGVKISAFQGKVENRYEEYSLTAHNIHISSFVDSGLNRTVYRVCATFPKAGEYHVALNYNGSQMMSYLVKADSGGAKAIPSDDTTRIKPSVIKVPLPERIIRVYDPNQIVLNEPSTAPQAPSKQSLQSRTRGMLRFVVNDARLGGKFVERFERAIEKRDVQRALAICDTLIDLFPGKAGTYFLRGMTRATSGDHRGAIEDFSTSDSLEFGNAMVQLYRGISYYRLSQYASAVQDISRAMEHDDDCGEEGLYWRGLARAKTNLPEKAFRDLWEAHERGNQDAMTAIEKYCARQYASHKEKHGE